MEKKERPDDYWKNYKYYKNEENKKLMLNNISKLSDDVIITLYKYNKIYLEDSLKNSLDNKIKILSLEIFNKSINNFDYQDYIEKEITIYNDTIKTKSNNKYDLVYRSRNLELNIFNNGFTNNIISKDKNNVIMIDYLLFNKNFLIKYDQVEWLFNYCRIRNLSKETLEANNFYCVDGWVYHSQLEFPEYKIYWDCQLLGLLEPTELVGYDFPNKLSNRKHAIEMYLLIGANCPDKLLNWNNYLVILEWYKDNKEYFDAKTFAEFYKINIEKKSYYSKDIIDKIKKNYIKQINNIPYNLINWSGEFIEKYLTYSDNIKNNFKNAYNQRNQYNNNKLWEYMCKEELETSKKIYYKINKNKSKYQNRQECIKISSRFDNSYNINNKLEFNKVNNFLFNIFCKSKKNQEINKSIIEEVSMMDFIVYNKFNNISYEDIGWIIQFCNFEWVKSGTGTDTDADENFNIDGWYFNRLYYSKPSKPNYIIEYKGLDETKAKLQLVSGDDDEKRNILRFAIQLANESPIEYVNLNNYYIITHWYNNFDPLLQSSRMSKFTINYYLNELEKKNKIELNFDNLQVKIDNKLTRKEIVSYLYRHSEQGQVTNNNLLLKETKDLLIDLSQWENLDFIKNIADAQINTEINLSQLNLIEFYKANGKTNTLNLISSINTIIKNRFNVHNVSKSDGSLISKEELLVYMCNIIYPIQIMELEEASKLLNESDYFDYLKGVKIKTSFDKFPIIDYERYDKYYNEGTFLMVISNLIKGNIIEK